jgi:hypothetical protein
MILNKLPTSVVTSYQNDIANHLAIIDAKTYLASAEELLREQEQEQYDIKEDFDWFSSGQVNTDVYKGQYIAIWKKRIVGNGNTPLETERIAKFHCGENCRPAIVYIQKDDEVDTIF